MTANDSRASHQRDIPLPDWMRQHLDTFGPEGLLCVDRSGTVLSWNTELEDLLGETAPEWTLRSIAQVLGWDTAATQEALLGGAAEHGRHRTHLNVVRPTRSFPAEITATLVTPPGESRCFFIYVRDEGELARIRRERMELELQNRLLMTRAGGLILIVDPESGTLVHANAQSEEYLRAAPGRLRGRPVVELFEQVEAFVSQEGLDVLRVGSRREIELTIPSADGTQWLLLMTSTRIPWHGKEAIQWVGRDVTDRRSVRPPSTGVRLPISAVIPSAEGLRHPASQIELGAVPACEVFPEQFQGLGGSWSGDCCVGA